MLSSIAISTELEPDGLLHDGKCTLVERLGLGIAPHARIDLRQIVERTGKVAAGRALLLIGDHALRQWERFIIFSGTDEFDDLAALREQALGAGRRGDAGGDGETKHQRQTIW